MDRDLGTAKRFAYSADLPSKRVGELGLVSAPDVEPKVGLGDATDIAPLDSALVFLRVDHPYARGGDRDVVDVAARARQLEIVQQDGPISQELLKARGQKPLPLRPLRPRDGGPGIIGEELDEARQWAPALVDLLLSPLVSALVLAASGRTRHAGHDHARGLGRHLRHRRIRRSRRRLLSRQRATRGTGG